MCDIHTSLRGPLAVQKQKVVTVLTAVANSAYSCFEPLQFLPISWCLTYLSGYDIYPNPPGT